MATRVGITSNEYRRKSEWEAEHPNLYGWKVLARNLTREAAQAKETEILRRNPSCEGSGGGRHDSDADEYDWIVYQFHY